MLIQQKDCLEYLFQLKKGEIFIGQQTNIKVNI